MKRARDIKDQLVELCKRVEIDYGDPSLSTVSDDMYSNVRKAFLSGFFYNTAKLQENGIYKALRNNNIVQIHPSSCLFQSGAKYVDFYELVFTTKEFMRQVMTIEPEWLHEIAPHIYKEMN